MTTPKKTHDPALAALPQDARIALAKNLYDVAKSLIAQGGPHATQENIAIVNNARQQLRRKGVST